MPCSAVPAEDMLIAVLKQYQVDNVDMIGHLQRYINDCLYHVRQGLPTQAELEGEQVYAEAKLAVSTIVG